MDGRSLAEQGGQEHKREVETGKKRAREGGEREGKNGRGILPG